MPLDGHDLVIEPKYPRAAELMAVTKKPGAESDGATMVNEWWSERERCSIIIWRERDGRLQWGRVPGFHHISHDLMTLGASAVWGIAQEHRAVQLLGSLVRHHQLKQYLLTGMFLETSKRSRLTYLFRRLKPTVVLDARENNTGALAATPWSAGSTITATRIICTLCLHPIAYYSGSWAGAMTPTDDVIAHLMLMRGDEHMLWRRANQHPPTRPEAGL